MTLSFGREMPRLSLGLNGGATEIRAKHPWAASPCWFRRDGLRPIDYNTPCCISKGFFRYLKQPIRVDSYLVQFFPILTGKGSFHLISR